MSLKQILNLTALVSLIAAFLVVGTQALLLPDEVHVMSHEMASFIKRSDALDMREVPLGGTEYVDGVTKEKMGYDWVVNREYRSSRLAFSVYIGYWTAGRRPVDFVAAHTPDRCWPMAGFTSLDSKSEYKLAIGQHALKPAEWRRFNDPHARSTEVVFWHLVGGMLSSTRYDWSRGDQYLGRALRAVRGLFAERSPQFFVRVTSSQSFNELVQYPEFQNVMMLIADATSLWESPIKGDLD